jgi:protein O-mannosyl-transferase
VACGHFLNQADRLGRKKSKPKSVSTKTYTAPVDRTTSGVTPRMTLYILVPCAAAILIFLPTLHFGFVGDDHAQIERNPQLQSWAFIPRLLTTEMWSQLGAEHEGIYYRPLFSVWLLLIHTLAGSTPWAWHLVSILLHGLATIFVFKLLERLTLNEPAACFGALIFALHPIHIEAIAYVSVANEPLYTICALGSLLLLLESQPGSWDKKACASLVFWVAALLFKETAIVLVFVIVVIAFTRLENSSESARGLKGVMRWAIPWFLTTIAYVSLRTLVLRSSGLEIGKQSWRQAILNAPGLIVFYLRKLLLPWRLSSFYFENLADGPSLHVWLAISVVLAIAGLSVWAAYKRFQSVSLGEAIVILPLIPILGGLRVYEHGNIAHDRYLYLPSVGLCILATILFSKLQLTTKMAQRFGGGLMVAILASGSYLCLSQQTAYVSDRTYYARGIEIDPQNATVWELWGRSDLAHHQIREGLEEITQAHRLAPGNTDVDYYYARGLFESKRCGEAEPLLEKLSSVSDQKLGRRLIILLALAQCQLGQNKVTAAQTTLNMLSQLDNEYPGLHQARGNLYRLEGQETAAAEEFVKEAQLKRSTGSRTNARPEN